MLEAEVQVIDAVVGQYHTAESDPVLQDWNRIKTALSGSVPDSAALDKCPNCGGVVEVLERSNQHWGGMDCRALPSGANNNASPKCGCCGSENVIVECGDCKERRTFGTWSAPSTSGE